MIGEDQEIAEVLVVFREVFQDDLYHAGGCGLREGDVVLDVGANIGLFTDFALKKGVGRVVAFEPVPEAIEIYRANLLPDERVNLVEKAVGSVSGQATITTAAPIILGSSRMAFAGCDFPMVAEKFLAEKNQGKTRLKDYQVGVVTIDQTVKVLGLDRVDFIKMDIEGSELEALKGADRTIREFRPRLAISSYHQAGDVEAIREIIETKDLGYQSLHNASPIRFSHTLLYWP
jgi:FkbM family methyltransferase